MKRAAKVQVICSYCKEPFLIAPCRIRVGVGKFCSRVCSDKGRDASTPQKGRARPQTTGDKNGMWRGARVGYVALHAWITRQMGKASDHICAMKDHSCEGRLEWSNKTKKYTRDLSEWWVLCVAHHRRFDGNQYTNK